MRTRRCSRPGVAEGVVTEPEASLIGDLRRLLARRPVFAQRTRAAPRSARPPPRHHIDAATLEKVSIAFSTHIFISTFSLSVSPFEVPDCVSFGENSPCNALPG